MGVLADGLGVGAAHVHRQRPQVLAALGSELVKEALEGAGVLALLGPDDLAAAVVGDQGEVVVLLAVGDLVHPRLEQLVQTRVVELVGDHPLDDRAGGAPVDAHQAGDRGLVGVGDQPGDEVLEVAGEPRAVTGERHRLDHHPLAAPAVEPPQPAAHHHPPDPEVQRPPRRGALLPVVPRGGAPPAMRALQQPPPQPDIDEHDPLVVDELHTCNPGADEVEQLVEYSGQAHDLRPFDPEFGKTPRSWRRSCAPHQPPGWPTPRPGSPAPPGNYPKINPATDGLLLQETPKPQVAGERHPQSYTA